MARKCFDTGEYVSALRDLVREGHEVSMLVWGWSMTPFLGHNRDHIFFKTPDRPLKKGDIVFYQRDNGQFVMHRICKVKKDGYYIVGDAQTLIEGPVRPDQVFALIDRVERKGKMLRSGDWLWDFFEKVWIRIIPLRPILIKGYAMFRRRG